MSVLAGISLFAIIAGYSLALVLCLVGEIEPYQAVWWPLELIKGLWRTFWRSILTGWEP